MAKVIIFLVVLGFFAFLVAAFHDIGKQLKACEAAGGFQVQGECYAEGRGYIKT